MSIGTCVKPMNRIVSEMKYLVTRIELQARIATDLELQKNLNEKK
jgi:hypothetical protein